MGFTSQRAPDMTNHDYTLLVSSRPSEPITCIIRGERERLLPPDIRVEPNICITVLDKEGTIIAWRSHNQGA